MVEQGTFRELDVWFYLADRSGQPTTSAVQTSVGTFRFEVSSAGARGVVFDNSGSLVTSKNITIDWCVYG